MRWQRIRVITLVLLLYIAPFPKLKYFFSEVVQAQDIGNTEIKRKADADKLYEQGKQKALTKQYRESIGPWERALNLLVSRIIRHSLMPSTNSRKYC